MTDGEDKTRIVGSGASAGPQGQTVARLICSNPSMLEGGVGAEIVLTGQELTVGRSREADVRINAESISRLHARLFEGGGFWGIKDLDSTNGIKINGEPVKQGWMRNGDAVTIGKVGYAYTQETVKPAGSDGSSGFTDTIVSDRTMFVGQDTSAASALLKATAAAKDGDSGPDTDVNTEPTGRERTAARSEPEHEAADQRPGRTRRRIGLVPGIAIGAAVVGVLVAAYLMLSPGDAAVREAAERSNRLVARFVARDERKGILSGEAAAAQAAELSALRSDLEPLLDANPDATELRALHASIRFLEFSREFATMMTKQDMQGAARSVAAIRVPFDALADADLDALGVAGERAAQMAELLDLAEAAVELKTFVRAFPDVDVDDDADKPTAGVVEHVLAERQRFASLRRQHNLAVTVTYPHLGAAIGQVTDSDLSLLDRWQRALR